MSINRPLLIIAGAGLAAAAALAVPAWRHFHETPPPAPPALRLDLLPSAGLSIGAGADHPFGLALSPDGRRLAFPASRDGAVQIWVREVTTGETAALPGTDGGIMPFWSPDGSQLGFFAGGRLKTFSFDDGHLTDLVEAPAPRGAAFRSNSEIVVAPNADGGLFRLFVDAAISSGGLSGLQTLTTVDESLGERAHRFPVILDDRRNVLFFVRAASPAREGIWVQRMEPEGLKSDPVRLTASDAHAIAGGDWILYAQDGALLARRITGLDRGDRQTLVGPALLVGTPVGRSPLNQLSATVAADLVAFGRPEPALRQLRWVDRQGTPQSTIASDIDAWDIRIAPTGHRAAVTERDAQLGTLDIFVYDGTRPLPRKISRAIDVDDSPVWSPDGSRIAWVAGGKTVTIRGAEAELPEESWYRFEGPQARVWDWWPDGRHLLIGSVRSNASHDLFIVSMSGKEAIPFAQTAFNEQEADVSPDGKWIAYVSDESGKSEIYIDMFPPGQRSRVTSSGGNEPRWGPGGTELYFRRGSEIHVVKLTEGSTREAESSTRLFDAGADIRAYDVTPDGRRFLLNVPAPGPEARPTTVVVNWRSLLGRGSTEARTQPVR